MISKWSSFSFPPFLSLLVEQPISKPGHSCSFVVCAICVFRPIGDPKALSFRSFRELEPLESIRVQVQCFHLGRLERELDTGNLYPNLAWRS